MHSVIDRLVARSWRAYADARRRTTAPGAGRAVLAHFGSPRRRDVEHWNRSVSEGFESYRAAFPPAAGRASVVCVSERPHLLDAVVDNVRRQQGIDVEFVLVTNHDGFGRLDVERALSVLPSARIVEMPAAASLGRCLNAGFAAASERHVAKFDDDDWYGSHHVADSLRAHGLAAAGVVGKHSYYAELLRSGERLLRFPANEFRYSGTLAGGTLVVDRDRTGSLEFEDRSLGEDRAFIAACHRRGVSTFSADRFGFIQRRGGENTWPIDDDSFRRSTRRVDPDDPVHVVER